MNNFIRQVNKNPDFYSDEISIRPTKNAKELRQAFHLVYQQYLSRGYMGANSYQMRFSLLDLLPCTTTFVASKDDQVIGTVSAVLYTPAGLPSINPFEDFYSNQLVLGKKIGEGTKLACHPDIPNSVSLSQTLIKWLYSWGRAWALDELYVVVNPRHAYYWEKGLSFKRIETTDGYDVVNGHPGILYQLNLGSISSDSESRSQAAKKVYGGGTITANRIKTLSMIDEEDVYGLLKEDPNLLLKCNSRELEQLRFFYPNASDRIHKLLRRRKVFTAATSTRNIGADLDYLLDTYEHSIDNGVYLLRPEALAFRSEINRISDPFPSAHNKNKISCSVRVEDDVPDNLVCDRNILSSIITNIFLYLNKLNSSSTSSLTIDLLEKDSVEAKLNFNFASPSETNSSVSSLSRINEVRLPIELQNIQRRLKMLNSLDLYVKKQSDLIEINFSINFTIHEGCITSFSDDNYTSLRSPHKILPLNFLVVEDNYINQVLMKNVLRKRGHQVTVANNGLEAVNLCSARRFDCVIMDCQMPLMDGFEATKRIRQFEERLDYSSPIIALTAFIMRGDMERCLKAGMDAYLTKPLHVGNFFSTVERVISERTANSQSGLKIRRLHDGSI